MPVSSKEMKRSRALIQAAVLAVGIFVIDYGLKRAVEGSMQVGESLPLLPGVFGLTYIENPGGAFGILGGSPGLLLVGSFIAVAAVVWMMLTYPPSRAVTFGGGLVLGGAAGNLLDRATVGSVVDYVDLEFWPLQNWPIFNAADIAVVGGAALLGLAAFQQDTETPDSSDEDRADPDEEPDRQPPPEKSGT